MKQTIPLSVLSCLSVIVAPALATPHSPLRSVEHQTLTSRAYNGNDSTLVARDEKGWWMEIERIVSQTAIVQVNGFAAVEFNMPLDLLDDCLLYWLRYDPLKLKGKTFPWPPGGLAVQLNDFEPTGDKTSMVGFPATGNGTFTVKAKGENKKANYEITFPPNSKFDEYNHRNKLFGMKQSFWGTVTANHTIVGEECGPQYRDVNGNPLRKGGARGGRAKKANVPPTIQEEK